MNINKQVKNLGMNIALVSAVMMSSTAVNAATISFAEGDQVINPNVDPNFSLTLTAEGLKELSYGGGLGLTFDPTLVSVSTVTIDPDWNFSSAPVFDNAAGTIEFYVGWFDLGLVSPVDPISQNILSIDFVASTTNVGSFDFGFYDLGINGVWGYTPDFVPVGDGDLAYCLTMDSATPTTCIDIDPDATGRELLTLVSSNVVVPVPAAVWLFGSGLIGLVAVSRRKAA